MKSYKSQIDKVTQKIADYKAVNKAHSAQQLQSKLNHLVAAVSHQDEAKAEKAAAELKDFADELPKVESEIKDSLSKKK
jgi:hypothetical protein